jgi:hypothetical protein
MRRAVPLAAVAAIAATASVAVAEAAAATLTAKVSPKPVLLNHEVSVKGQLSTHQSGVGVVLETSRFPFSSGFSQIRSTTTGPNGDYLFFFKPTLATRVRVHRANDPSTQSGTPTAYVIADYTKVTCSVRTKSGKTRSCKNPGHGDMTIHLGYHLTFPASAYAAESAKKVYVYYGQRNGSATAPGTVQLRKTVNQKPLGNNKTEVKVSYFVHAPTTAWSYHLATCIKFTEAADGVGLPGHHGCGDQTVSNKQASLTSFG